jgi:hypothetical protein
MTEATKTADSSVSAPNESELKELGFTTAALTITRQREMARKLRIAFEHFRVVTPDIVRGFQHELYRRTKRQIGGPYSDVTYDQLAFTEISQYPNVPPQGVLNKVKEAKDLGCFDYFEVATIQSVRVIPDPIIFGRISGSDNRYYIAQWDNDVKIEDILRGEEEGFPREDEG